MHVVPVPRVRDGRAVRYDDTEAHAAAVRARDVALRVADDLDERLRLGPRGLDDFEVPEAVRALGSAVAGADLDTAAAFHELVVLAAPVLRRALTASAVASTADDRLALARRVAAVLGVELGA